MVVFLYARVSSHRQEKEETVETQLDHLTRWAALNKHEIGGIYMDEAVKGTVPLEERPDGRRMLEDIQTKHPDAIAVYRLDRIGRSVLVIYQAIELLDASGVAFVSATEPYDTTSPAGRIFMGLLALFAEFEKMSIAQRCNDGKQRAAREGRWPGGREKYGYQLIDKRLVVDAETAAIVKGIWELFVRGQRGLNRIAADLDRQGVPNPSQRRGENRGRSGHWQHTTLHSILTDPAYKGRAVWSGIEFPVPPIVSESDWEKAQALLTAEERRGWSHIAQNTYLLSGMIQCGICHHTYQGTVWKDGRKVKSGHLYTCRTKTGNRVNIPRCRQAPWLDGVALEQQILADCRRMLDRPELLVRLLREQHGDNQATKAQTYAEKHRLQERCVGLQEEQRRLLKLYRQADITEEEWREQKEEMAADETQLRARIAALEAQVRGSENIEQHLQHAERLLQQLRGQQLTDGEVVRMLIRSIECDVTVTGEAKVAVYYWPSPESVAVSSLRRWHLSTLSARVDY